MIIIDNNKEYELKFMLDGKEASAQLTELIFIKIKKGLIQIKKEE